MPLFSSPGWNVNIRPESHLVSTIKIDGIVATSPIYQYHFAKIGKDFLTIILKILNLTN